MAENSGSDEDNTNTHKRTFSTGPDQKSVDDPSASVDEPPPTKKTKLEGDDTKITPDDGEELSVEELPPTKKTKLEGDDTKITLDDGDELIPLTSQGPNIFYGYGDALLNLLEFGEEQGPYWLKSIVMERYIASPTGDHWLDEPITSAGITSIPEYIQMPETKLLSTHFGNLSGWWYEVTVMREKPDGKCLKVNLESSKYDQEGYIWGGKDLGEWWVSDIQVAEGESLKAIKTMHESTF